MLLKKETSFPRGGKKPALFKSSNNSNFSFLRKPKVKPKKKNQKLKLSEKKIVNDTLIENPSKEEFIVKYVEDLKQSVIQDGMLVLGIISKVTERLVNVSLPGGLRGVITSANVSEFYKSIIEISTKSYEVPTMQQLFNVGEVLPVKVLAVSENHRSLMLTCDPKIINEKLSYNLMEDGFILPGSVKSQEEHGYVIDFGIKHVTGFLNFEKVNTNRTLNLGQIIRCCIIKCKTSPGSCNTQLSILKNDLHSAFIKKNSTLPVSCFIPGFQFEVKVKKILFEGVEVSYNQNDFQKGYIHEDYFLKKFSNPTDLELGSKIIATLLYVKPLVNFLYFKILPKVELKWPFEFGDIVSGKVVKVRRTGVIFKISEECKNAKCFVPLSKLKDASNLQDKSEILNLYPLNKKVPKIRLGHVDFMGRYYLGATDKASVMEKYYSIFDIKCGEIVPCNIVSFGKSSARLEIGRNIKGIVNFTDMSDVPMKNPKLKFKPGQKVKARVLEIISEKFIVRLTMKPTLLKEKEILCELGNCKKKNSFVGTVIKVLSAKVIVRFFNGITGVIPKHLTPYLDAKTLNDHFYKGQLLKCNIVEIKDGSRLLLSLLQTNSDFQLEVGQKYKVAVMCKTASGLFLKVFSDKNIKCQGYLPNILLTQHSNLVTALHSTYSSGEKFSAYCIINNTKNGVPIFGAEDVFKDFYEGKSSEELEKLLTEDSVLPFLVKSRNLRTNCVFLQSLLPGKDMYRIIVIKHDFPNIYSFFKYRLIYGKILNIRRKKVNVSTKLYDVWDRDFHSSLDLLDSYLTSMTSLVLRQKSILNAYNGNLSLNCPVKGVIEEVKTNHAIVRTEEGDLGIVEGKYEQGQNISGKIIWIDGPQQIFYIKTNVNESDPTCEKPLAWKSGNMRGKVVFINQEVIVLELKGRGRRELAFLPQRRHLNDILNTESIITVGEELKVWITKKSSIYFLGMDRRIVSLQEKIAWRKSDKKLKESVQSLKRKLESEKIERLKKRKSESESDEIQVVNVKLGEKSKNGNAEVEFLEVKEEKDADDSEFTQTHTCLPRLEFDDIDIKSEADAEENEKQKSNYYCSNGERIELSSSSESEDEQQDTKTKYLEAFKVGFNWEVLNNNSLLSGVILKKDESSSDDEDDDSKKEKKKRRRLTAAEKREKAKSEEERLRFIEERLMDTEREPECADDFDRAVLAEPNSSALWLKYMSFHIQGTEIEKARAVAKRALKAISFREEQEKLNVWIALLNLENMYGNEDSLSKTVSEALQVNEPYKIHLHMLSLHGQGNKLQEMEKLGNFMLKKYKDTESVWCDVAAAYFSVGKIESARNVLQKALKVVDKSQLLMDKANYGWQHLRPSYTEKIDEDVSLISKFAQLENKYGSPERAQTLYESILASFSKRVDIWSCYVDMLVKSNYIDMARQVLERATSQSLRPRKMKTLFKKFIAFEEAHGTSENVEKVREAAVEYVQTVGSFEG